MPSANSKSNNRQPDLLPPLRRKSSFSFTSSVDNDDAAERSKRRNEAELQRNISHSTVSRTSTSTSDWSDQNLQENFDICLKMFLQNKLNTKNVWEFRIFEYMGTLLQNNSDVREILQKASTSFDIGAKIYSLRVDDIHANTLKLASTLANIYRTTMAEIRTAQIVDEENPEELECTDKSPIKKRKRHHLLLSATERRVTVVENEASVNAEIPKQTTEKAITNSTNNYLNLTVLKTPGAYELLVKNRCNKVLWCNSANIEPGNNKTYAPIISALKDPLPCTSICPKFNGFAIDLWEQEEDTKQLESKSDLDEELIFYSLSSQNVRTILNNTESLSLSQIVYNENGIPLPQLEDDLHDNDANNNLTDDNEIILDVALQAQRDKDRFDFITDMRPDNTDDGRTLEYSYRSIPTDLFFNRMWAGPLHWKLKYVRPDTDAHETIFKPIGQAKVRTKRFPLLVPLNFSKITPQFLENELKCASRPMVRNSAYHENQESHWTLPENLNLNTTEYLFNLFNMAGVKSTFYCDIINKDRYIENSNDCRQVSSDHGVANIEDDTISDNCDMDDHHSDECDIPNQNDTCNLSTSSLIKKSWVTYALKAKKFDMKKLKTAMWDELMHLCHEQSTDMFSSEETIQPIPFSKIYRQLPNRLSEVQVESLSGPLAFVALLHLANDHSLFLQGTEDLSDIYILKNA